MKGLKLRTIVGLFCLVLCAAGVLVAHVWKQNAYVRLSMYTVRIAKQRTQLQNDIALLEISVGGLRKLSRIEAMAKGRFGLEYGNAPVLVYLESNAPEANTPMASASVKLTDALAQAGTDGKAPEARGLEAGKVAWRIKGF